MPRPNDPLPSWMEAVRAAKADAFDRMSPEDRAAADEAQKAARARKKERRREGQERVSAIVRLVDAGHTAAEIGARTGRNWRHVIKIAAAHGVAVSRSEACVTFRVPVSVERRATLRALAARHGVMSDVQVLEALIAAALDDDGVIARFVTRNPDGARAALVRAFTAAGAPT